ncbi:phosphotransferase family protein [Nocardia sp. NPDC059239]|uniref:phosphotransferase family protein n=1 Tax=unclassified Nocardia TaxID=2637762 RepID=UPI0036A7DA3E
MTMNTALSTTLPGLDLDRVGAWLFEQRPELTLGPLSGRVLAGGKSNLTYEITDGRARWVVRRPPLGHVLATAHDMGREFRVLTALAETDVPVPRPEILCDDTTVADAPFYVMEHVAGTSYGTAAELTALGEDQVRAITTAMIDTLASLHRVRPNEVGLEDFGRPIGFLGRQVHRWKKQFDASHPRDLPAAEELYLRLAAAQPPPSADGIVHGDYRLDNLLVEDGNRVAAVVDWEMATVGDPLTDVALLVVYHRLGAAGVEALPDVSRADGFLTESEILDRYTERSGRALSHLGFYLALASFKTAVILEGIHYRYRLGKTVGPGFDSVGDAVEPLLEAGLAALQNPRF